MRFQSPEAIRNASFGGRLPFIHWFGIHTLDPPRFHNQQNDPTDKRKSAGHRGDEVAVSGLNMQAEKIDRLARRRKGDARVGEHNDAERNEKDRYYGFCIHFESP